MDVHCPELLIGRHDHAESRNAQIGFRNQDNHFCIGDFLANLLITVVCERDGPCIEDIRLIVMARGVPDSLVVRTDDGFRISRHGDSHVKVAHVGKFRVTRDSA
jgi:hypothetical protein